VVNSERAIFCCIQNIALLAKWALRALIKMDIILVGRVYLDHGNI
jgi:hypothetical protein